MVLPLTFLKNSKGLLKTMVKFSTSSKRRLIIEIWAAREAFGRNKNSDIGWTRYKNVGADGLAQIGHSKSIEAASCGERVVPMIE